jgi:hypothetical protein
MGVARLSLGGPALPGIMSGGRAAPPTSDMGGAAALLTGLWLGEAGMERPSLGPLLLDCERAPGMGGRRRGAGDAMSARPGGSTARCGVWCWSATVG